jgi:hypothetical protein
MTVTLESRVPRSQTFNLDHASCCTGEACGCREVTVPIADQDPRTGERWERRVARRVPASLTLLALERRAGVPRSALGARELRAAIQRGYVRVFVESPASPVSPVAATTAPEGRRRSS